MTEQRSKQILSSNLVLNRRRIRKSRVEHRCCYCAQSIPAGSSCYSETGLYDGAISTIYRHASHGGNFSDCKDYP